MLHTEVKEAVLMLLCFILGMTGSGILSESIEYYFRVYLKRIGNQELWNLSQLHCQILSLFFFQFCCKDFSLPGIKVSPQFVRKNLIKGL